MTRIGALDTADKLGRMSMMRLKVEEVGKSLLPSEAVVAVRTKDGLERLVVSRRSIVNGAVSIGWPIRQDGDTYLVELPRETQSGAWRVWVGRDQLEEAAERMPA
jgi:hypothetical protein